MKRILLPLLFALLPVFSFSQKGNHLVVFNQDGSRFWLIINGIKQNNTPETHVRVVDLIQPSYKVKVIFENKVLGIIDQSVHLMWEGETKTGYEFNYQIVKGKKGYRLKGQSAAPLSGEISGSGQGVYYYTTGEPMPYGAGSSGSSTGTGNTQVQTNTQVSGGSNSNTVQTGTYGSGTSTTTTTTTSTTTTTNTGTGGGEQINVNMNMGGTGVNMNVNVTENGMNTNVGVIENSGSTTTTTTTTTVNSGTTSGSNNTPPSPGSSTGTSSGNSYNGPYGCAAPMSGSDFEAAKKLVAAKGFDETRFSVAKQVAGSNCLTSVQVKELMQLMSFEQTRLDFAKFAYGKTYDPGNYFRVNEAFQFEGSVEELNKFISGK
jgi:hypothetical protein